MSELHQRLVDRRQQFARVQRQRPAIALRSQMRPQRLHGIELTLQRQAVGVHQLAHLRKKQHFNHYLVP
ncbi:hypothetical protein D3C76_1696090 [compost metagenome]